jgi:hypothetical protein
MKKIQVYLIALFFSISLIAQNKSFNISQYNVIWDTPSKNSGESMPCGGGDIGTNVWVEKGDLLLYLSRSGAFEENGVMPKFGRIRLRMNPNPFIGGDFRQELELEKGFVTISAKNNGLSVKLKVWVDVFNPAVHVEVESNNPVNADAFYESWRTSDHTWTTTEEMQCSRGYFEAPEKAVIRKDSVQFDNNRVLFYHRNRDKSIFDMTVSQQGLDNVKDQLWNPLLNLTFGGSLEGDNMKPAGIVTGKYAITDFKGWKLTTIKPTTQLHLRVILHKNQTASNKDFINELSAINAKAKQEEKQSAIRSANWWKQYWERGHIAINTEKPDTSSLAWQVGRNYNVFRYQLGCNAFGNYPTKFNGGLFTFDPCYVHANYVATPDHRDWGGVTFTAQNQRLLYWPMLKSGDFDMIPQQLDFYVNAQKNAEIRTEVYWGHKGASFTEQMECFGLPVTFEYGWNRPKDYPNGVEYNRWLEYVWDTSLEFCMIALDKQQYDGEDIGKYIPLIESCLTFFNEHYQQEALKRTQTPLDGNGKLVIFPGSGAETFKVTYNASSTVAALKTVLTRLLALPLRYVGYERRGYWEKMLKSIPEIPTMEKDGHKIIAPAQAWFRRQNHELTQLYPVYPWGIYGVGKPDLQMAIDTWLYGAETPTQKECPKLSWHQEAIFCARLGLTDEAKKRETAKLRDSGRRFPTFWGPGHDWVPDHNWGGSGMIGLQEMLMQTDGKRIMLFPAWPKEWYVDFKLHAPYNTVIEGVLKNGKIENLIVTPEIRKKDIEIMLKD